MYVIEEFFICLFHAGKRVFLPFMRFCPKRTHEETCVWARQAEEQQLDHVMGITGESVFFQVPGFDVVKDILPEALHMLDGGFMKNTCGRTFSGGSSHQTTPGYKRTSIDKLTNDIR